MLDIRTISAFLGPEHHELADSVERFAIERLAALEPAEDDAAARAQASRILGMLGAEGWCRYAVPAAFGGVREDVDLISCCLIRDALAAASPLADSVFALQCLGSLPIALFGSDELRQTWLPRVADGSAMAGFAMTEAEAGSDVKAIQTLAKRTESSYEITGRKVLISNAGIADFYTTFARSPDDDESLSCFVVPAENSGCRFVAAQVLSSPHPLGELAFEDCPVPLGNRLGEEGEGFSIGMQTLDRLRVTVAAAACGMGARALAEAKAHALERKQFGRTLSRFQLVQQKLARMATELTASRLLVYRAARAAVEGDAEVTLRSAMAKYQATEAAQRIVDDAVQILGGAGVLANHPVDRLYRSVRALRIYEGTSEVQQLIIAREILRD